jgi:hypothetical protein
MSKRKLVESNQKKISFFDEDPTPGDVVMKPYLNACGKYEREKFPIFGVTITYYKTPIQLANGKVSAEDEQNKWDHAEEMSFIWTGEGEGGGFKIFSASLTEKQ